MTNNFGFADSDFDRLDPNHWRRYFIVDGLEECRRFFRALLASSERQRILFAKMSTRGWCWGRGALRICGDYKIWAAMALERQNRLCWQAFESLSARTAKMFARETQAGALDIAEYFYVMLSILCRVAHPGHSLKRNR